MRARPGEAQRTGALVEVAIDEVGGRGDGIAQHGGAKVFVPLTLPGDRLEVRLGAHRDGGFAAEPVAWFEEAPRAAPRCPHFGICGGCQLQHLLAPDYTAWQVRNVRTALARRGLDGIALAPPRPMAPATRRRARFGFQRHGAQVEIGFRTRAGRQLVDVEACAVLLPEIVALLEPLRATLRRLPLARRGGEALVTATDSGLDLVLIAAPEPDLADREQIAAFAAAQDLARVSWRPGARDEPEPIVQRRPVRVILGGVVVEPPPGAFLQASVQAEAEIRDAVVSAIGDAMNIADLFAGCGSLGLPLAAEGRRVHAVESRPAMVTALLDAARAGDFGARVTAEARDLERAPLTGADFDRLDAVILDPPRAGARAQAVMLAASRVGRIAMVSCNPASFARDARILVDGGYRLVALRLIGAFLWSCQIELVGAFVRP
jgi:23S rRNA (uracil1939-C5)-methyltransferase